MKTVNRRYAMLVAVSLLTPAMYADGATGDANRGKALWNQEFTTEGKQRNCATCHTADPGKAGKHMRTGKLIEPMAPAVNRDRLTDKKIIEKWFRRNCNWTIGRECTAQEKADVIEYLKSY